MLDSLYIRNFRIFKELEIERLARVNLIVGRNNSGKSCLLEAVSLFAQGASPMVLDELIRKRGQDWEIKMRDKDQPVQESENPLRHLFHGYRFPEIDTNPIEVGSLKEIQNRLKLFIRGYQFIDTQEKRSITRINKEILSDNELNDVHLGIELLT